MATEVGRSRLVEEIERSRPVETLMLGEIACRHGMNESESESIFRSGLVDEIESSRLDSKLVVGEISSRFGGHLESVSQSILLADLLR
mmetsp:Transcript_24662/g.27544  ORF Transcript_24662/g.27544 Transcript_24662/m.27544 type:complete len:88 (+) Transcript_24662:1873-2136(+)